jgi:probable addiction module antidote protein
MTAAAKAAGVSRTSLYQSLSEEGHPAFETIGKVAQSLGYRLSLVPVKKIAQ